MNPPRSLEGPAEKSAFPFQPYLSFTRDIDVDLICTIHLHVSRLVPKHPSLLVLKTEYHTLRA